ncbi:hypothetical protein RSOLAG22IIIB_13428 [Rhizoctonia solani]|uniref:Alpha-L-rhamnosidase C-terminal domain-containing protein n=1 Tax=Rhizoctonia solani TaxID=456999 RepID=A0A0K6FMR4_9AGAM|nr:hypothetical protein RSOLAG22IIIB_13428 [Rhizoctonia solani]
MSGVAAIRVPKVIRMCTRAFGIEPGPLPGPRSVGRLVTEGEVAAKIQAGNILATAEAQLQAWTPDSIGISTSAVKLVPSQSEKHLREIYCLTVSKDIKGPSGVLTTGKWHNVKFSVRGEGNATMAASINGIEVETLSYDGVLSTGPPVPGLTAGSGNAIIIKDLLVQDICGTTLYFKSLTTQSALEDFATGTNNYGVCFEGVPAMDFNYYDATTLGPHIGASSIIVWALRNAAIISKGLGDSKAPEHRDTANKIANAVNKHLFDNSTGAYMLVGGNKTVGISQDGNSYAILAGIANAPDAPSSTRTVIEAMQSLNTPFGPPSFSNTTRLIPIVLPYASGFHIWAVFEAGMNDEGLMRTVWKNQSDMNNPWYTGMMWEFIDGTTGAPHSPNFASQAHGWGSAPTWQLSRYVLGVSPATPEYSTWSFAPRAVNLTFANGRVPTLWATIIAAWENTGSTFNMRITAPAGANGTIAIAKAANKTVSINGVRLITHGYATFPESVMWAGAEGDAYRVNVTTGTSALTLSTSYNVFKNHEFYD